MVAAFSIAETFHLMITGDSFYLFEAFSFLAQIYWKILGEYFLGLIVSVLEAMSSVHRNLDSTLASYPWASIGKSPECKCKLKVALGKHLNFSQKHHNVKPHANDRKWRIFSRNDSF